MNLNPIIPQVYTQRTLERLSAATAEIMKHTRGNWGDLSLVGSRAFSNLYPHFAPCTATSDWDYIISMPVFKGLEKTQVYQSLEITPSDYNSGIKIKCEDAAPINLIPLHPVEYNVWMYSTQTLQSWAKSSHAIRQALSNKSSRIALFEATKATYRTGIALGTKESK